MAQLNRDRHVGVRDLKPHNNPDTPDSSTPKFRDDNLHLFAVIKANSGRGFPYLVIDYGQRNNPQLPTRVLNEALDEVSFVHGVSRDDILGDRRFKPIAHARQHAMWLLSDWGYGLAEIGRKLGRDHSTVFHGVAAHEARRRAA
jgi:hypothetical protein